MKEITTTTYNINDKGNGVRCNESSSFSWTK
jgi:hypothetical protein